MTAASQAWTEEVVELAGSKIQLVKGGSGEPLLILHDEMGHPGWLRWHQELAQNHTLYIPSHSGYGGTPLVEWILGMRDLAGWYLEVLDDLGLGPVKVIGSSLGAWLAAEMAAMSPSHFQKMVLVGPMGIRPPVGQIYDMFLVVSKEFITANYHDPAGVAEFQQICRMSLRRNRWRPGKWPERVLPGWGGVRTCTTLPCHTCCTGSGIYQRKLSGEKKTKLFPSARERPIKRRSPEAS